MYRLTVSRALSLLGRFETIGDVAIAVEAGLINISALPGLIATENCPIPDAGRHPLSDAEPIFSVLETLAIRITRLGPDNVDMAHECEMIAADILGLRTDLADIFYEMNSGGFVIAKAINDQSLKIAGQSLKIADQTLKIERILVKNEARLDGLEAREAYQHRDAS
jgi:hypothetical protein